MPQKPGASKTKKSVSKRFKVTGTGKLLRRKQGRRHLLIKKNAKFSATPVIMLSSKDGLFDRARGRMVGSDEYLTKPFTKDSLLKTVGTHSMRQT